MTGVVVGRAGVPGRSAAPGPVRGLLDLLAGMRATDARRLGLTGSLLMAVGALGAGALPVPNPLFGLRLLGLPGRNATLAVAVTYVGMGLLVLAWWSVARSLRPAAGIPPSRAALLRTALTWAIPLITAPPLFSRDVYSYLAQGGMVARGLDPFVTGPAAALGVDDLLVRSIPTMWRDTPTPYGPLFLLLSRGIAAVARDDIVLGLFAHRALALVGVVAMVWALPRLARRYGMDGNRALWLGAAHPLVLFHLVSGAHNDALMIGLFLLGLEVGLRAGPRVLDPSLLGGAVLIVCASAVKLPALMVLGFLGLDWARRRGGKGRDVAVSVGVLSAVTISTYAVLSPATSGGWGWVSALSVPGKALSWMSPTTVSGLLVGWLGRAAGLGEHTDAALAATRGVGLCVVVVVCVVALVAVFRGRLDPLTGVAAALGSVVLLGPTTQPWYLLWAMVPLAAASWKGKRRVTDGCAAAAVLVLPTGAAFDFRTYQLVMAIVAAIVIFVVTLVALGHLVLEPAARSRNGSATAR